MQNMIIQQRFCGPTHSANGGYACGMMARHLEGDVIVRLMAPPPLDTELALARNGEKLDLLHGDTLIASARQTSLELNVPAPPSWSETVNATERYSGFTEHPYPGCFVCGPDRAPGDGLRIFAGQVTGREVMAAPWIPDTALADAEGLVAREYVWAALDCPGAFVVSLPADKLMLLGELAVHVDQAPRVGRNTQVIAWLIEEFERKFVTGTALIDEAGDVLAYGRATWVILK